MQFVKSQNDIRKAKTLQSNQSFDLACHKKQNSHDIWVTIVWITEPCGTDVIYTHSLP